MIIVVVRARLFRKLMVIKKIVIGFVSMSVASISFSFFLLTFDREEIDSRVFDY